MDQEIKTDVIIVGAGAAGLIAARELSKAGKSVVILEARDRIGGRIYPLPKDVWGFEAEGGGEFVHGAAPITTEILTAAGATLTHGTEWWNVFDGEPRVNEFVSPHDAELEAKLAELTVDMTIEQFFERYFPGEKYASLRDYIFRRSEGYDAADVKKASVFELRDALLDEAGWKQHNIKEGYGLLLNSLLADCAKYELKILREKIVKEINFGGKKVIVTCADSSVFGAQKVIITVPVPLLHELVFVPDMPHVRDAASKIGFGAVIKVLLRFKNKWWAGARERNFERMFFMFSHEEIPTWWTQYPEPHLTLTGWLAGPKALMLKDLSDEAIIEKALHSLANIFKVSIEELKVDLMVSQVINWPNDPFARGAYSYATPESSEAVEVLKRPIDNKIYFAGEALGEGDTGGTVEAALASGLAVAELINSNTK